MKAQMIGIGIGTVAIVGTIVGVMAQSGGGYADDAERDAAASSQQISRGSGVPDSPGAEPRLRVERREIVPNLAAAPERAPDRTGRAARDRRGGPWGRDGQGFERPENWEQMSRAERREYMRSLWQERRAEWMDRYDTNGDGELDEQERVAMRAAATRERMEQVWGGDIPLTDEELAQSMRLMRGDLRSRFQDLREVADENGDGEITEGERGMARDIAMDMFGQIQDDFIMQYDSDRSGGLDESERAAAADSIRRQLTVESAYSAIDGNNDGVLRPSEIAAFNSRIETGDPASDLNSDGIVNSEDAAILIEASRLEPRQIPQAGQGRGDGARPRGGPFRGGQRQDQSGNRSPSDGSGGGSDASDPPQRDDDG